MISLLHIPTLVLLFFVCHRFITLCPFPCFCDQALISKNKCLNEFHGTKNQYLLYKRCFYTFYLDTSILNLLYVWISEESYLFGLELLSKLKKKIIGSIITYKFECFASLRHFIILTVGVIT